MIGRGALLSLLAMMWSGSALIAPSGTRPQGEMMFSKRHVP